MIRIKPRQGLLELGLGNKTIERLKSWVEHWENRLLVWGLLVLSVVTYWSYYRNGLGLAYNDARSHLDIGRRVVEGLKPGLAQLGSVWLPLNHILMVPTIWNDWMWHSGLSGAIQSMVGFVITGLVVSWYLKELKVGLLGRLAGVGLFIANLNVLYLQSTAMTELLLIVTMTLGAYELLLWHKDETLLHLIKAGFWIMMSTLVRYDGWFLLVTAMMLIVRQAWAKSGYKKAEGVVVFFMTLAALGIGLWLLWNLLIFKDPLYFAFGPFSAHAQQQQLNDAGVLITKSNWLQSVKVYAVALLYNSYTIPTILAGVGMLLLWADKSLSKAVRWSSLALLAPLVFNILALYLGFSVLFIQGIAGNTWFNVRYGIMLMPAIAIFIGFLVDRAKKFRPLVLLSLAVILFFALMGGDAVTIDDARVGSSQKNVSEVSGWLRENATGDSGYVLISAASHDAIIFSSGLPMSRFIHEGTGKYWLSATAVPDRWAKYIIMRTHDKNDLTFRLVSETDAMDKYTLIDTFPFADIYELKPEYWAQLETTIADPEVR